MLPQVSHGAKALGPLSVFASGADPICPKAIEAYHVPFDDYLIADKAVDRLVARGVRPLAAPAAGQGIGGSLDRCWKAFPSDPALCPDASAS